MAEKKKKIVIRTVDDVALHVKRIKEQVEKNDHEVAGIIRLELYEATFRAIERGTGAAPAALARAALRVQKLGVKAWG